MPSVCNVRHDAALIEWMRHLPDKVPIRFLSLPGTHDSATFDLWSLPTSLTYLTACVQTQHHCLQRQLEMGIRFLDLRVKSDGWLYHGPISCKVGLACALQECTSFVQAHPSEFVFLRIKDEEGSNYSGPQLRKLMSSCEKRFPLHCSPNLASVGDVRGTLVVLQDWSGPDMAIRWGGELMFLQDNWAPNSLEEKWCAICNHFQCTLRMATMSLCVNFISAQMLPRYTAHFFAEELRPKLTSCLNSGRHPLLGIVVMDFPTEAMCAQIVQYNFSRRLTLGRVIQWNQASYTTALHTISEVVQCSTKFAHAKQPETSHLKAQIRAYVDTLVYGIQFRQWVCAVNEHYDGRQQTSLFELNTSFILDTLAWQDGLLKLQSATKMLQAAENVPQAPMPFAQSECSLADTVTLSKPSHNCTGGPAKTSLPQDSHVNFRQVKLFKGATSNLMSEPLEPSSGTLFDFL